MFWCVDDDNMCVWSLNVNPKISLRNNRIGYIKQRERQRENITSKKYVKINIRIIIIIKTVFFLYFFFWLYRSIDTDVVFIVNGFFFCFCFFSLVPLIGSHANTWTNQPTNQPTKKKDKYQFGAKYNQI